MGILPSFWALYLMKKKLEQQFILWMIKLIMVILAQKSINILESDSMFDIIKRTKKIGGKQWLRL